MAYPNASSDYFNNIKNGLTAEERDAFEEAVLRNLSQNVAGGTFTGACDAARGLLKQRKLH